jgi:hypothetical protein
VCSFTQTSKEGCLSCSGLTGQKNVRSGAVHKRSCGFNHIGIVCASFHATKKQRVIRRDTNNLLRIGISISYKNAIREEKGQVQMHSQGA